MFTMPEITQGKFKILSNKRVGTGYFKMAISAAQIVRQARPGQFVYLRCLNSRQPLLRRPFSLHRINQPNFEILYKVVGFGTNLLAKKKKGDIIDILGPLGNGFDSLRTTNHACVPTLRRRQKPPTTILVAGGIGVAPLLALAEKLTKAQEAHSKLKAQRKNNILVLVGAKNKEQILCERDFKKLGVKVHIATDDGSRSHKGPVTELLKKLLRTTHTCVPTPWRWHNAQRTTIYACGPKSMLKEIGRISRSLRISAWASFEENMACGVGACLGCAIKTRRGYKRVCKDGPVFNLKEIRW